jgi:hypothetical protein
MDEARLPAHLEVAGLLRRVQAEGGFGTVIHKGERDAGAILIVLTCNGKQTTLWERMPSLDGTRKWSSIRDEDPENRYEFSDYLTRRSTQDRDTWIIELDIANGERFIRSEP